MRRWIVGLALACLLPHAVAHDSHPQLLEAVRGLYDYVVELREYTNEYINQFVSEHESYHEAELEIIGEIVDERFSETAELMLSLANQMDFLSTFLFAFYLEVYPEGALAVDEELFAAIERLGELDEERLAVFKRLLDLSDDKSTD